MPSYTVCLSVSPKCRLMKKKVRCERLCRACLWLEIKQSLTASAMVWTKGVVLIRERVHARCILHNEIVGDHKDGGDGLMGCASRMPYPTCCKDGGYNTLPSSLTQALSTLVLLSFLLLLITNSAAPYNRCPNRSQASNKWRDRCVPPPRCAGLPAVSLRWVSLSAPSTRLRHCSAS